MKILVIFILFALNGLFAMCEIALVSSRKARLEQKASKGSRGARIALELLKVPEKFLSTVQIGITLVGIITGAYGGLTFAEDLIPVLERVEFFSSYASQVAFTLVVICITYFSLLIGELVPKTIALNNPEAITIAFAPFMRILSLITYPIVSFLSLSTRVFLKILMIRERKDPPVTEEELKFLIDTGSQHGIMEKQEGEMMKSIFRFGDSNAQTVMTHRDDIVWLDIHQDRDLLINKIFSSNFTKFPVCDGHLDKIVGILLTKDILEPLESKSEFDLREKLLDPIFIAPSTTALKVLELFRKKGIHMGIVIDEKCATKGLVTLHDLVENIFGELPDLYEIEEIKIIYRRDGSMLIDGEFDKNELKLLLKIELPVKENFNTLGGLVTSQLKKVPRAGDFFILDGYKFEVMDMDGTRVDKVLVSRVKI